MPAPLLYSMFKTKTEYPLHTAIRAKREDVVFLYLMEFDAQVRYFKFICQESCFWKFLCPLQRRVGGILIYPCPSVRLSVCPSGYRYMVYSAISSYSFGATALIFCRMFIHIMEVCMSTGFWLSSNILKMTGSWT